MYRTILLMMTLVAGLLVGCASEDAETPTETTIPPQQTEEIAPTETPDTQDESLITATDAPPPLSPTPQLSDATEEVNLPPLDENAPSPADLLGGDAPTARWVVRGTDEAPVHACDSTDCDVVATLADGDALDVIEEGSEWHQIRLDDGTEGFIEIGFLNLESSDGRDVQPAPFGDDLGAGDPADFLQPPDDASLPPGVNIDETGEPPVDFGEIIGQTATAEADND